MGLVALRALLEVLITATVFIMMYRGLGSFWQAWPITALAMWAIHHCLGMQPMLGSILMFTFELALILEARRRRTIRLLYLSPVLFLIWANLHIQFVYGLVVLFLLAAAALFRSVLSEKWSSQLGPNDRALTPLLTIVAVSVLQP